MPPYSRNTLTDYVGVGYADDKFITYLLLAQMTTYSKIIVMFLAHYYTTCVEAITLNIHFAKVPEVRKELKAKEAVV